MREYRLKLSLISVFGLFVAPVLSVCPEMEVWSNGTNYRYLIKDFHIDYKKGSTTIKQHHDILWAASQKKSEGVLVLVEDSCSYDGFLPTVQNMYKHTARTIEQSITLVHDAIDHEIDAQGVISVISPLSCLTHACQQNQIPCFNTECMQAIENYAQSRFPAPTQEEIINDLTQHIDAISACPYTKKYLAVPNAQFSELMEIKSCDKQQFIQKVRDLRINLVNAKTIYHLAKYNHIKHIFICEGEDHIQSIKNGLTSLGYSFQKNFGDAQIWKLPWDTPSKKVKQYTQMITNALDLQSTFKQIFASQSHHPNPTLKQPQKSKVLLTDHQIFLSRIIAGTVGLTCAGLLAYYRKPLASIATSLLSIIAYRNMHYFVNKDIHPFFFD